MSKDTFQKYHIEKLKDKEASRIYLEVALEEYENEGDSQMFLRALKDVAEAQGGITRLARKSNLNRQNLYKVMSGEKRPRLETISHINHSLGFKFSLQALGE